MEHTHNAMHDRMDSFESHKIVKAAVIHKIEDGNLDYCFLKLRPLDSNECYPGQIEVARQWLIRKTNTTTYTAAVMQALGGVYVLYADGYTSWSPRDVFDSGYRRLNEVSGKVEINDNTFSSIEDEAPPMVNDDIPNENPFRFKHRAVTELELTILEQMKDSMYRAWQEVNNCEAHCSRFGREFALARTKLEEACMWAVKGVTSSEKVE